MTDRISDRDGFRTDSPPDRSEGTASWDDLHRRVALSPINTVRPHLPASFRLVLPVDRWTAFFNLALGLTWMPLVGATPLAGWFVAVHLTAAAFPWLLARAPAELSPGVRVIREIYPVLWIGGFWSEFGLRYDFIRTLPNDALVTRLDWLIFGFHPHLRWMEAMPLPWLSALMQGAYFTYYPLLLGTPIVVLLIGPRTSLRRLVLRLAVGYLGCFLVYLAFPVEGPTNLPTLLTGGGADWLYAWNDGIRAAGDSLGTAFPSSHVVGSFTIAWIAWETGPRWIAWLATAAASLIPFATVYTRNHLAVDALAGLGLALVLQALVVGYLERRYAVSDPAMVGSPNVRPVVP